MIHLVMKDIRLVGLMNLVILGIGIFGGSLGMFSEEIFTTNHLYGLAMISTWFVVNNLIYAKELNSKPDALIISLPVKKPYIVKSRYLTMLIYILGTLVMIYLTSNIAKILFDNMPGNPLSLMGMLIIASIMIIFTAFYIPFQYYNQKSAQFFPAIILILSINILNIIERLGIDIGNSIFIKKVLAMDLNIAAFILLGGSLILYLISLFVAKGIYEAKEF